MGVRCFIKIDPERGQRRWYTVAWGPTLFGDWAVVRSWGRLGTGWARCRSETFDDDDAARAAAEAQVRKRLRRGYRPVGPPQIDGR
jgi:predicted DNA-binding WGR domain protein